ncbi:hypothetical protein GEMRC1_009549 [Eukaryota sp. GEM-RC1]
MYTLQNLLAETSKHPLIPPNSLDLVRRLFDQLSNMIQTSLVQNQSIHIHKFGTFHVTHIKLDVGNNAAYSAKDLSFSLDPFFRRRHRFQQLRRSSSDVKPVKDINYSVLAAKSGTSKEFAQDIVRTLVDRLSDAVSLNQNISIAFLGVGKFYVRRYQPSFIFTPSLVKKVTSSTTSSTSSTAPDPTPKTTIPIPSTRPLTPSVRTSSRVSSASLSQALSPPPSSRSLPQSSARSVAQSSSRSHLPIPEESTTVNQKSVEVKKRTPRDQQSKVQCIQSKTSSIIYCTCDDCRAANEANIFANRPSTPLQDPKGYRLCLDQQLNEAKQQRRRELLEQMSREKEMYEEVTKEEVDEKKRIEQMKRDTKTKLLESLRCQRDKNRRLSNMADDVSEHFPIIEREDPEAIKRDQLKKSCELRNFQYKQWQSKQEALRKERLDDLKEEQRKLAIVDEIDKEERLLASSNSHKLTSDVLKSLMERKQQDFENESIPEITMCARSQSSSTVERAAREKAEELAIFQKQQAREKKQKMIEEKMVEQENGKKVLEEIEKEEEEEKKKCAEMVRSRAEQTREELLSQMASRRQCRVCYKVM